MKTKSIICSIIVSKHVLFIIFIVWCLNYSYAQSQSSILSVDYSKLISRSDIVYEKAVSRSEEGLPIGNGRMGSLAWTTSNAIKFQINRVDVYANNSSTMSFNERHQDYCGGCGFVDIDFITWGGEAFPKDNTRQHLSVHDGMLTISGDYVNAELFTNHAEDILAIKVEDKRETPFPININLRMLRAPVVKTKHHTAQSDFIIRDDKIILTQKFTEGIFYCGSAVVIGIVGRESKAELANDSEIRLSTKPGNNSFVILVASAASFDKEGDIVRRALQQLESAERKGYERLKNETKQWWNEFWAKSFVHLKSDDGNAEYIEENYTYYLYIMASSSQGILPPKFNGMIWNTKGDLREWGSQHWWYNVSCLYRGLPVANHYELMEPVFSMYSGMYESCSLAAHQQWDSKGIFIPEVVGFDGLARLPEDIAQEMQNLYLLRKPWESRTARFEEYAWTQMPHASRWNWLAPGKWVDGHWIVKDKGAGQYGFQADPLGHVFGHVVHMFSQGAKIAYQYWLRYEYTLDKDWLRNRAYPMLKGVTEFYRNYPNVKKGIDGKYHIHHVNNQEAVWGAQDAITEMAAMHGIIPITIRASEVLDIDADMRTVWQEFLKNLAPLPRNDMQDALIPKGENDHIRWSAGFKPAVWTMPENLYYNDMLLEPVFHYDLWTMENKDPEMNKIANATFDGIFPKGTNPDLDIWVLYRYPAMAALLGRGSDTRNLIQAQLKKDDYFINRLHPAEGGPNIPGTTIEGQGRAGEALQLALIQCIPSGPGKKPVIRVFPAWQKDWDAEFSLLCRGGFLVTSSIQKGLIDFVEIYSQLGQECQIRNPWEGKSVTIYRNGEKWQNMKGRLLTFTTSVKDTMVIVKKGFSPERFQRSIL